MARIKHWLLLSRLPFLSVMIVPYILGAILAARLSGKFNLTVFLLGLCGASLVQLVAHYSGEVYDIPEDRLSITLEKNFFSGGSQVLVENHIPQKKVKVLIGAVVLLSLVVGAILQFYFKTGKWTLLLGALGIICGFFYSQPPLRWVNRGLGEIFIAFAFGWLAVNAGFYIQASGFNILATLVSFPIACAVVNIILINEYPDYPADRQTAKRNILVRLGKEKGAVLYALLVVCAGGTFLLALVEGLPLFSLVFYIPVFIVALRLAFFMLQGLYKNRAKLERMCGLTILVSLGTSLSYILGLLFR
jgi:1,4-dihydroxy-2-naphthoate polyprenyltransferase